MLGIDFNTLVNTALGNGGQVLTGQKSLDEAIKDEALNQITGNIGGELLNSAPTEVAANAPDFSVPVEDTLSLNKAIPNNHSIGNSANIQIPDSAIQSPPNAEAPFSMYDGATTSSANLPTPEDPATFLGLEGKDFTKMGVQAGLGLGANALMNPSQDKPITHAQNNNRVGKPINPQGNLMGVNSMTTPVNSMQMTQAQGLISPFQKDIYRRRGY